MMRILTTLSILLFPLLVFAQPENDDCSGLIDLGVAPACPDTVFFTNVDATASDIGFGNMPTCFEGGTAQNDVWFAFTTSDTIFDYTITVTGLPDGGSDPLSNPQVALYRGDCTVDGLAEIGCASAEDGEDFVELDIMGLTPNITYFIRINDYSATATPNWGTFQLCVDEMEPASTIDEGGSTACSGILFDSGGEDGDYQNDEDYTFTICPDQPHDCIIFTLDYYFIELSGSFDPADVLAFYDGDTPSPGNLIDQIGGFDFENDGGGGVCYQVQATSGCLTVVFTSDGTNTFEGFAGQWECTTDCEQVQPLTVEQNITEDQIIDFVSTPTTQANITNINCPEEAYGLFEQGDNTDLGLERGLVMTSGSTVNVPGPNNNGGAGVDNFAPGDPDLDYLSTQIGDGVVSQNACVIELDVLAATNELTFEYVFGSEEYPEYVNEGFNDIFAFFISGPGIVGDPAINNQLNIATLPDGMDTPVQINSVNNQQNWEYYRDNDDGLSLQYDGLTSDFLGVKKSLTARAQVQPCSTYHLKFAIADRGDGIFDSGVFISELKGGTPNLTVQFNSGIDYLVEDCVNTADEVLIELSSPVEDTTSFVVVIGGTATPDVDYTLEIPDTVTFLPGQTSISFPIQALSDLIQEPDETISIALTNDFGCGEVIYTEVVVDLVDQISVNIQIAQDTALVCQDSSLVLEATGASSYFWTPVSVFDNPTSSTPTANPETSQWVYVEGLVGPCVDYDSIYLQLVDPQVTAITEDTVSICQGESVQLQSTNNVNNMNLQWAPGTGLDDPTNADPLATPEVTTEYVVSVEVAGCFVYDTVFIDVSPFDFPDVIGDTLLCQGYSAQLASTIDADTTTTTFEWTPNTALDDDMIAGPVATPQSTVTYTLIATSANEACADTAEVTVEVFPADVQIENPDSTEICLGDTVMLSAITSTGAADGLVWSPDNGTLSDTSGFEVFAIPEVSGWYYSAFTVGQCTVFDSAYVRVDSLPNLELMADPDTAPYCQGETVTLSTPAYEPGFYPDIEHLWLQGLGYETPDTLFNMVFITQDTFLYQRVTTNRACMDTSEILINVIEPPITSITPADTTICLGGSVQFLFEIEGQYETFTWSGDGLSCTECFDPVATPTSAGTANYQIEIEAMDCNSSVNTSFQVISPPTFNLNPERVICLGEDIQLNFAASDNATYTWTSTDPDFFSDDPMPVVTPAETTTYFLIADNGLCDPVETEITVEVIGNIMLDIVGPGGLICSGDEVPIVATAIGGSSDDTFNWVDSNGDTYEGDSILVAPMETTQYNLTYVSGGGCETIVDSILIDVEAGVVINDLLFTPDTAMYFLGDEITITADYITTIMDDLVFSWFQNDTLINSGQDLDEITVELLEPDTVAYTLLIETPTGCTAELTVNIVVERPMVDVPNIFTPNGDDHNDFFDIVTETRRESLEIADFKVFNRWGQLVYDNETPDTGWDGTLNDNPQPTEAYFYQIKVAYPDGETISFQGNVTLVR